MRTGAESLVYDGEYIPTVSSMRVSNLKEGWVYQYRVAAINRVGEGEKSPLSAMMIAAQVPARGAVPEFVSATASTIGLRF